MAKLFIKFLIICIPFLSFGQTTTENRITSIIDSSQTNNVVLKQTFVANVALDSVWNAYTTKKGWESWVAPIAEVDFRINGTVKTNYNKEGTIGDDTTITLHIRNYIPKTMITLQAEISKNFPEFMKKDAKDLYNIIVFEQISPTKTKVTSYGLGYKNNEKYKSLMKFFIKGNEQSYLNLLSYLETGKPNLKY